jgi:hypothetical protein
MPIKLDYVTSDGSNITIQKSGNFININSVFKYYDTVDKTIKEVTDRSAIPYEATSDAKILVSDWTDKLITLDFYNKAARQSDSYAAKQDKVYQEFLQSLEYYKQNGY